jgi:ketosteroid isomerase-like protein
VIGDESIRVKATERVLEHRWTQVFTVRDSKVTDFEKYVDLSALVAELEPAPAHL